MQSTLKWLYTIPGKKKGYVLALTLIQAVSGGAGVLYALLLRNIVDSAVARDLVSFRQNVITLATLVLILLGVGVVVRWLNEQARTDIENLFKKRLADTILRKDYASVSAVHSGEWMTRLTSDTSVVAGGYVDLLPVSRATVMTNLLMTGSPLPRLLVFFHRNSPLLFYILRCALYLKKESESALMNPGERLLQNKNLKERGDNHEKDSCTRTSVEHDLRAVRQQHRACG